jgi:FixJ family two-component response regulator
MTTSPCASRGQTCCGSSASPSRPSHSAEAFLASEFVGQTDCLIVDIAMVGVSGPDLQQELTRRRQAIPIVFITAHGDATVRPRLLALDPEDSECRH